MEMPSASAPAMEMPRSANVTTAATNSTIAKLYNNAKAPVNIDIMDQKFSIQEGRARDPSGRTIQGAKAKFMNYFLYAMAGGERINSNNLESCSAVCSEWKQKCCATVTMTDRRKNTSFMYHCINNSLFGSKQDMSMSIDDYDFNLKCDHVWAGAMSMSAKTIGAAGLLMATIY